MDKLSYYPDPTMKRAKQALSEYLGLPVEYVLPTAGGISAIDLATHLDSTDMLQFTPCFAEYSMLSENRGKTVGSIPLLTGKHEIGDPAEQAKDKLFEGCTVWLCNPLNPIGCAFTVEQIKKLLSLVEEKCGWLVVDEAFIEYCPNHSVVGLIPTHERLLVTGSMTKILGIPGVRLGYLCAQPHVLEKLKKHQLTWELSCFAEAVAMALPAHKADILADSIRNAENRKMLVDGLQELGIHVYPSQSACVLADFGRPVDAIAEALKERKILVRSCMSFDDINDGCHLRLAVKDEVSNQKLIETLREVLLCAEKA
jgi:histidinol-phosphate/aromatic aminotransferase/cobyric acid decarboxylase-like protein